MDRKIEILPRAGQIKDVLDVRHYVIRYIEYIYIYIAKY